MVTQTILEAEKKAFEERGYHVLPQALTPEEVAAYRNAVLRILRLPADHPYSSSLLKAGLAHTPSPPENPQGIWAGFDLPLFDDGFYDLAFHPRIALAVDGLIGPDINLYETSFIAKVPHFPGTFRDWHQDSEYSDPQSNDRNVTVILCLDDMDGQSGATWVVPGSHKYGPLPHVAPSETVSSKAREVADKERFHAPGHSFCFQAGDALIFLARLVHKSGPNATERSRLSLAYNYVRKDNLDLQNKHRYIGMGTPIVRNGRIYSPFSKEVR
ncbi:MAG TPA: phytanoyl-CoA dioxygenase family protein [Chthonomonadaceae bacterium]|nr:phytanoyl-CoA dioxygenase family protein [Chthonomonadaceae bacterium]